MPVSNDHGVTPAGWGMSVDAHDDPALGVGEPMQRVTGHAPAIVVQLDLEPGQMAVRRAQLQEQAMQMTAHAEIAQLHADRRHPVAGTRARFRRRDLTRAGRVAGQRAGVLAGGGQPW
jgi:hypothetical protein